MSAKHFDFDVVISGYGPAGQAAASLLARAGHKVGVFEKYPALYGAPRLCTVDGESARIIQQAGDVNHAFRESTWCRRFEIRDGDGDLLLNIDWSGLHICGYPGRISFYQPDVEDAMDQAARARGAEVNQGWEVVGLDEDAAGVTVTARCSLTDGGQAGQERVVRTRYLIASDGARSFVRESLGIERDDLGFRDAFLSIDCERLRALSSQFDVAYTISAPGKTVAYIPIGRNRMRFEYLVDPDADHSPLLVPDVGYDYLEQSFGITRDDVRIYRQVVFPFEGKVARTWRQGRVFLAGDAAHVMPPFLGQGACSALRDAANLSWKLDLVLRGVVTEAILDSYETERLPHAAAMVQGSVIVGQVTCERDPVKAAERDALYRSGQVPPPNDQVRLLSGILHRDRAGDVVEPTADLMEQGIGLYHGKTGRFDDLVGTGFHLIAWEEDPLGPLDADRRAFLKTIDTKAIRITSDPYLDGWLDLDRTYESWFTDRRMLRAVLVRPDFSVFGGVWDMSDLPALVDDLRAQLTVTSDVLANA